MKRIAVLLSCALLVGLAGCPVDNPPKWVPVTLTPGTSTKSDVVSFFGAEPDKYAWGTTTYTASTLPLATYYMSYVDGTNGHFDVVINNSGGQNTVIELRIEHSLKYRCEGTLVVGSTPSEVFAVVGNPTQTIVGDPEPAFFTPDVFYQNMNGEAGYDYYDNTAHSVRMFFLQGKATVLYVYGTESSLEMLK